MSRTWKDSWKSKKKRIARNIQQVKQYRKKKKVKVNKYPNKQNETEE